MQQRWQDRVATDAIMRQGCVFTVVGSRVCYESLLVGKEYCLEALDNLQQRALTPHYAYRYGQPPAMLV